MSVITSQRLGYETRPAPASWTEGFRGKLFVYPDFSPDGGAHAHRIFVAAPRQLFAETLFHIVPRDKDHFLNLNLAHMAEHTGSKAELLAAVSDPFEVRTSALITAVNPDTREHTHIADVVPAAKVAWPLDIKTWMPIYGRPHEPSIDRLFNAHVLSRDNVAAIRNQWPRTKKTRFQLAESAGIPIPQETIRRRVMGDIAVESDRQGSHFLAGGKELMTAVLNIADVYGEDLLSPRRVRVLELGVGCGRLARHLPHELQSDFVGSDVDAVNIEWCAKNFPFGRYEVINPHDHTKFKDGQFDLVYSHSMITHLSEADQYFWLRELNRICSGLMILAVNGSYHAATVATWGGVDYAWFEWLEQGFHDGRTGATLDLADRLAEYGDAVHAPRYVREHWNKVVEIVDIIPGGFGRIQDAVVCRPRGAVRHARRRPPTGNFSTLP